MWRSLFVATVGSLFLEGCSISETFQEDGAFVPTIQGPAEPTYCPNLVPAGATIAINGTAKFNRRNHFGNTTGAANIAGLGSANPSAASNPGSTHPIRYAEIRVTSPTGSLVACTETNSTGAFTFMLPGDGGTYTVSVNSRSQNSRLYASVLNRPDQNKYYSLTATVIADISKNIGVITAPADSGVLAGAFNILDQFLNANEYLVDQTSSCSSTFTGCGNFDPTQYKASAYWMPGFNPNDYFGSGGGGLSFYLPGYQRIFILGGINGDTDSSDTDHFDNSVILHEYGHFLEDMWFQSDSPGGPHNGNEILDPRLAWSEGWGNFFQAAVRSWVNDPFDTGFNRYIDTMGNTDGVTQMFFYVSTENNPTIAGVNDYTANLGEGNFREFAVTRLLYDVVDVVADTFTFSDGTYTDVTSNKFVELWAALTKNQNGLRDSNFAFRNVGLMLLAQDWMRTNKAGAADIFASDWTQIRGLNRGTPADDHYAQFVVPTSGACQSSPSYRSNVYHFALTPVANADSNDGFSYDDGQLANSNMFLNNRFYHLRVGNGVVGPGTHNLELVYQDDDGVGSLTDLDLYLYNGDARFAVSSDIVKYSTRDPQGGAAVIQNESMTVTLPSGDYLINVNVYTGGAVGEQTDFNLLLNGTVLCPADILQ